MELADYLRVSRIKRRSGVVGEVESERVKVDFRSALTREQKEQVLLLLRRTIREMEQRLPVMKDMARQLSTHLERG